MRVVWVSSHMVELSSPKGGVDLNHLDYKTDESATHKYLVSKASNIFHTSEFARHVQGEGIISVVSLAGSLAILVIGDGELVWIHRASIPAA